MFLFFFMLKMWDEWAESYVPVKRNKRKKGWR